MENKLLVKALKDVKRYFVEYQGMDVMKLASLLAKIDTALASVGEL